MIDWIGNSAYAVGLASKGNPIVGFLTVFLFWLMFSILEAGVEKLIWGARFVHWLDPIFMLAFMAYAGLVVWKCAVINFNQVF